MKLVEPSSVLLETGEECAFLAEDGSASASTTGLLENAISERETGETSREAARWELTCPTSAVAAFGEDDLVTVGTVPFRILDTMAKDSSFTVFLLISDP
ncbi:MAG: hypothetical protein JWO82_3501 [Akkermansiaceae bacterium]|nr:hypothetical protein [Akkermansiaceae bacterium]